MRTHSMSETARELNLCQIRVREALVQVERNLLRDAGVRPPPLQEMPRVARAPLEGIERASPRRWAAFAHPVFQLESLPRLASEPPRIHLTIGTVTAAGGDAGGSARPGALVVEVSADGAVHVRHVGADPADGSFHDLDARVAGGRVATGVPVEALVLGDIHHARIDPAVAKATWGDVSARGPGSLVDRLRPRLQVVHDVADFRARSHHDRRDHHVRFVRHVTGTESVREEMAGAAGFLASIRRSWGRVAVVHSNHDAALLRWLREADHRADPVNAEFLIDRERALLARLRAGVGSETFFAETLRGLHADGLDGVRFLADGESLAVAGVELGLHGHAGADGAHGARWRFERLGIDLVLGHSHRPTARGGIYTTGVCQLHMG